MKNILFCVPWYIERKSVYSSFEKLRKYFISDSELVIGDNHITTEYRQSCYIGIARNSFITGSLDINLYKPAIRPFDEFIFCDSDIEFTEQQLLRVLSYDLDIISLPYEMNSSAPCYCARNEKGVYYPLDTKDLQKVGGCGGGGLLKIKQKVFETVPPYWWFIEKKIKDGIISCEMEDFSFCRKAREAGFDIWVDFNYPLIHNNPNLLKKKEGQKMEQKKMVTIRQALNGCIKSLLSIVEAVEKQENQMQTLVEQLKEFEAIKAAEKPVDVKPVVPSV